MNKLLLLVTFIIRVGSGIVMLMQGYEKLTGGFTLKGLVPVIANNTDSPEWYKWFFANIVAHTTSLFDYCSTWRDCNWIRFNFWSFCICC